MVQPQLVDSVYRKIKNTSKFILQFIINTTLSNFINKVKLKPSYENLKYSLGYRWIHLVFFTSLSYFVDNFLRYQIFQQLNKFLVVFAMNYSKPGNPIGFLGKVKTKKVKKYYFI